MGLFDKKYCDVCGEKIGLLGNRKLEDGNLCKNCAGKLSPWFDERRHSTIAQIKEQLEYREQNRSAASAFKSSVTFGDGRVRFYIDEAAGKFAVTSAKDFSADNPDIVDLSKIRNIDLNIEEHRRELKQTVNGQSVSYNPPRYEYSYDFEVTVRVDHPYFDDMKFNLNSSSVDTGSARMGEATTGGWGLKAAWDTFTNQNKTDRYNYYLHMGEELKNRAMNVQPQAQTAAAAAPAAAGVNGSINGNQLLFSGLCNNYKTNVAGKLMPIDLEFSGAVSAGSDILPAYKDTLLNELNFIMSQTISRYSPTSPTELIREYREIARQTAAELTPVWAEKYNISIYGIVLDRIDLSASSQNLVQAVVTTATVDAMKAAAANPVPSKWFCTSCGAPNEGSGKFCNNCGAPRG